MDTITLEPISSFGQGLVDRFGSEWVVEHDNGTHLVVSDLDDTTTREVQKKHDNHFRISVGK